MNFWDTSAIVPLIVQQHLSTHAENLLQQERRGIFVWWGTSTECISALARLERQGDLLPDELDQALKTLSYISSLWSEIVPADIVRERANRLLRVHPLRTGDAFQLAAAIIASEDQASKIGFVTFDERLAHVARKEGFYVLP